MTYQRFLMPKSLYYMVRCSFERQKHLYVELMSTSPRKALIAAENVYPGGRYTICTPKPLWDYELDANYV